MVIYICGDCIFGRKERSLARDLMYVVETFLLTFPNDAEVWFGFSNINNINLHMYTMFVYHAFK